MNLTRCVNATTCLPRSPVVARVDKGCSANAFIDNAAYRQFLQSKFNITPIDMETAAVALVSLEFNTPFIAIRSLSDLAGGGSAQSNEAAIYSSLAAENCVTVAVKFISLLNYWFRCIIYLYFWTCCPPLTSPIVCMVIIHWIRKDASTWNTFVCYSSFKKFLLKCANLFVKFSETISKRDIMNRSLTKKTILFLYFALVKYNI